MDCPDTDFSSKKGLSYRRRHQWFIHPANEWYSLPLPCCRLPEAIRWCIINKRSQPGYTQASLRTCSSPSAEANAQSISGLLNRLHSTEINSCRKALDCLYACTSDICVYTHRYSKQDHLRFARVTRIICIKHKSHLVPAHPDRALLWSAQYNQCAYIQQWRDADGFEYKHTMK